MKIHLAALLMVGLILSAGARLEAQEESWGVLNSKAVDLYGRGEYVGAVQVAQEALKVAESTFGPDHPNVAASLNNLGAVYHAQGRYTQAELLYQQALAIDEKTLGKEHPHVATDRSNLAELQRARSQSAQGPSAPQEPSLPEPEGGESNLPEGYLPNAALASSESEESESETAQRMHAELSFDNGYRSDNLRFNIAGNIGGQNPNILSELTWSDLYIYQIKAGGRLTFDRLFALRGTYDYGWIFGGNNQDSDYLGDNRTFEFSRSNNSADDGSVQDASIGVGYPFKPPSGWYDLKVTPLGGYSYHEQNLTITHGVQTIPDTGPFAGLDSEYQTQWRGPWAGVDLSFKALERVIFFGSVEYHWARYKADARWNLRTDFAQPLSFRHRADGHGVVGSLGLAYLLTKHWTLRASGDVQDWFTDPGVDQTFASNGTVAQTRLNRVHWDSVAILLGATCSF